MIIAIGKSRKDKRWRNIETTWESLLARLREPVRTHESVREYKAMSKNDQGGIKDVGGFVGGRIAGGRRVAGAVTERSLITLDVDDASMDIWDDYLLLCSFRACCYSTHSHTPEAPRLRFVVPLSRPVTTDEYPAVARKLAEWIGIDAMDPTTYDPTRLMYWPSCPKDGEYKLYEHDGPVLSPDELLSAYGLDDAWRDASLWPIGRTEKEARVRDTGRQGDPETKPGVVGLFCRTYDIPAAIDAFLTDKYEPCNGGGRYTYTGGSTAGGAVLYQNGAFLYSHHATDPCGDGHLYNAFDLCRVHLFGELDAGKEAQEVTRRPSYKAACQWAAELDDVKLRAVEERAVSADEAFADMVGAEDTDTCVGEADGKDSRAELAAGEGTEKPDTEWAKGLSLNHKTGELDPTIENAVLVMKNDPALAGAFACNLFTDMFVARRSLPWRKVKPNDKIDQQWTDTDDAGLRWYLEKRWHLTGRQVIFDAWTLVVRDNAFHPIRDYLTSLTWDGKERAERLLVRYMGAEDNPYTRAVTRKWLCAAVARVMEPGRKFDNMLVLSGPQGIGKSTLAYTLSRGWFTDSLMKMEGKSAFEGLRGAWIVEIAELAAAKRSEVEGIKNFITSLEDTFRPAYGRNTVSYPRQCVFYGTTNDSEFLRDRTGNRRFWPVEVTGFEQGQLKGLKDEVDQIWAEAVTLYRAGEALWLDDDEVRRLSEEEQNRFSVQDELVGQIEEYLEKRLPDNWADLSVEARRDYIQGNIPTDIPSCTLRRDSVCISEIRTELIGEHLTRGGGNDLMSRRIANIMNTMPGWRKEKNRRYLPFYGQQRVYRRTGGAD